MNRSRAPALVVAAAGLMVLATPGTLIAQATFSHHIGVQGRLIGTNGHPITSPTTVTFSVYDDETDGSEVHTETEVVVFDTKGRFAATLGDPPADALDAADFAQNLWLEVSVNGGAALGPRIPFVPAPYALQAAVATDLAPGADVDFGSHRLSGLLDPIEEQDAATRSWVEDAIAEAISAGSQGPPGEIAGLPAGTVLSTPDSDATTLTERGYTRTGVLEQRLPPLVEGERTTATPLDFTCETIVPSQLLVSRLGNPATTSELLVASLTWCPAAGYEAGAYRVLAASQAITALTTVSLGQHLTEPPIAYALADGMLFTDEIGSAAVFLAATAPSSHWSVVSTPPQLVPPLVPLQETTHLEPSIDFRGGTQGAYAFFRDAAGSIFFWRRSNDTWGTATAASSPGQHIGLVRTWATSRLVLWGGISPVNGTFDRTGARYDPVANQWTALPTLSAPDLDPNVLRGTTISGSAAANGAIPVLRLDSASQEVRLHSYQSAGNSWTSTGLDPILLSHLCCEGDSGIWSGDEHFLPLIDLPLVTMAINPSVGAAPENGRSFGVRGGTSTVIPFSVTESFLTIRPTSFPNAVEIERVQYGPPNQYMLYQYRAPAADE